MEKERIKAILDYIEMLEGILENEQYGVLDWSKEAVEDELSKLRKLV